MEKLRDVNVFYHILNNRHARQLARNKFFKNIRWCKYFISLRFLQLKNCANLAGFLEAI